MSDTPGSLVDKLITVDQKLWHNQELLYTIRRMTYEEFLERFSSDGQRELYDWLRKMSDLNTQRNQLIDEFDQTLASAIETGDVSRIVQRLSLIHI
jgi:hypothetical protein